MQQSGGPLDELFLSLRKELLRRIPGALTLVERALDDLSDNAVDSDRIEEVYVLLHGLMGTAATFGFPEASPVARSLANAFKSILDAAAPPSPVTLATMEGDCQTLHDLFPPDDEEPPGERRREDEALAQTLSREILALMRDEELLRDLTWEMEKRGTRVTPFPDLESLREALATRFPAGVVVDVTALVKTPQTPLAPRNPGDVIQTHVPVTALGRNNSIEARLAAVRLGADRFLTPPVEIRDLMAALAPWSGEKVKEPFRALVVDDSELLTAFYAGILEEAGMVTETLNDPLRIVRTIRDFKPELVVLDVVMPGATGIEMAGVIRQYREFSHLPILFLSAADNLSQRLSDSNLAGENHLSKPVRPTALVAAVKQRIQEVRNHSRAADHLRVTLRELENIQYAVNRHAIVSATDITGRITFVNDKFCEISGYEPTELIGRNHRMLKSGRHSQEFYREMWESITSGRVWHGEIQNRSKDGSYYWVQATIMPLLDEVGKPSEYISIRTDITRRKEAEKQAHGMALFAEMNPAPVLRLQKDGRIIAANPAATRILEIPPGEEPLLQEVLPTARMIDVAELIAASREIILSTQVGALYFQFVLQGVAPLGVCHIYGSEITQLKVAQMAAEKANLAKSQFLSSMSHELRTPMNAVLGFSQLLESDEEEPLTESQLDSVQEISRAGEHLLALINEVLDLAKIESGKVDLAREEIHVEEILEECLTLVAALAQSREVTLKPCVCSDFQLIGDRIRVKQVLLNLLSNAIKYNRESGSVYLSCGPAESEEADEEKRLRLAVRDTGFGIPQEKLPFVFEPFNRLGAEETPTEGTGIGLVITKRLVELMEGRIGVETEVNRGTTFWIELPRAERSREEMSAPGPATEEAPAYAGNFTLLYIEDNPTNLKLMEKIIARRPDIRLLAAPDPNLGLELARAEAPDIILADISLPGMSGYELLEKLKESPETKEIPVLALSANAMPADVEKGLAAGFRHYLTKPLQVDRLMAALDDALEPLRDAPPG